MENEKKILIVDDDKDLCNLIYEIIKDEGFDVCKVYDGKSALDKMSKMKFDLMIIDNKLGSMSGIQVIEKAKDYIPELKTLMISAYGNPATINRANELGVYDFIDKPFDIIKLIKKVRQVITSNSLVSFGFV